MARPSKEQRLAAIHQEALTEFDNIQSALRDERLQCLQDRRFYSIAGAQWEGPLGEQFENKPKMEVNKKIAGNPIKQDTKKGKVRHYSYGVPFFNYGMFPQTWEDPEDPHPDTGYGGDNDPVDVLQINAKPCEVGTSRRCACSARWR